MSKRTIYSLVILVFTAVIAAYFIFLSPANQLGNKTTLHAVPPNSPLIVSINHPLELMDDIASNELAIALQTIPSLNDKFNVTDNFKQFIQNDVLLTKLMKGKKLLLSFNYSGKSNISLLGLIALNNKSDVELLKRAINEMNSNQNFTFNSRKYNKVTINEISKSGITYYLAIHKGIVLFSDKSILVEESIRQTEIDITEKNIELKPLLKTVGTQADLQIFINHRQIDRFFSSSLSKAIQQKSSQLKILSAWTELDVNLKEDKILLSGFSNGNKENNYYSNVLLNQQAVSSNLEKILPQSTSFYTGLCLSNLSTFFTDYEAFLEKRNLIFQRVDQLKKMENLAGKNLQDFLLEIFNQETALAGIQVDQNTPDAGRIWIVETKSGSTALNAILEMQKNYIQTKNLSNSDWHKDYEIDTQTSFTIHKFPFPTLPQVLFGHIFKGIEANWVTMYDNYLIFGDSFRTVAKAVHSNILGETLSSSLEFDKFKSNLNSRSNINFYCNTSISLPIANLFFNDHIAAELANNDELRKFKAVAWQITSTGEMLYNNSCLQYSSQIKSKPQTIWQSHINAQFDCKPTFVVNHYDVQNKEIVLHDLENNFYLVNNVGRIMWQIKLDAPILGEVNQIDYFSNGKLQYIFNTKNKLYLIDRNGNNVTNFPVNFRAEATNAVSIIDYENNKDYRFFVACNDLKIYAYDKTGNLLKGWNTYKTDHIVNTMIQHFRVEGKDYIVASDLMKDYILHRKGTIRVPTNSVYPHSSNNGVQLEERTASHAPRFVTTEDNGTIHYTYFDGKHEILNLQECGKDHHFLGSNLDNDEEMEYIFTNENQLLVYKNSGKQLLKKRFNKTISHAPHVYSFSSQIKKIGITCRDENKIYLMDINGTPHPGFPLDGSTEFSIGFISNENSNFNLLVGSPDSYLYNYYVE